MIALLKVNLCLSNSYTSTNKKAARG